MRTTSSRDEILTTIEKIYDASTNAEKWPDALASVLTIVAGSGAHLFTVDAGLQIPFQVSSGIPPDGAVEYGEHYVKLCPRVAYLAKRPDVEVHYDYRFTDERTMSKSEYYDWMQRAGGSRYFVGAHVQQEDGERMLFSIHRPHDMGHVGEADLERFGLILPHLKRAVRISRQLGQASSTADGLMVALNHSAVASILVDEGGKVAFANDAAMRILSERDGLHIENGCLHASFQGSHEALNSAFKTLMTEDLLSAHRREGPIHVQRISNRRSYVVRAVRFRPSDVGLISKRIRMAVFVNDPAIPVALEPEDLVKLYALTWMEARVAIQLAEGLGPKTIARLLGISHNTVRVHLSKAMAKTETHTQHDLVRILSQIQFRATSR